MPDSGVGTRGKTMNKNRPFPQDIYHYNRGYNTINMMTEEQQKLLLEGLGGAPNTNKKSRKPRCCDVHNLIVKKE